VTGIVRVGCCPIRSRGSSEALVLPDSQHTRTDGNEIVSGIERAPFDRFATTARTPSASRSVIGDVGLRCAWPACDGAVGGRRSAVGGRRSAAGGWRSTAAAAAAALGMDGGAVAASACGL